MLEDYAFACCRGIGSAVSEPRQESHTLRECEMRIHESLGQCETDAPGFHPGGMTGWGKTLIAVALLTSATGIGLAQDDAFLPSPVRSVSTIPANGDVNPYGVAFVPDNFQTGSGPLKHGDILVSNFNNIQIYKVQGLPSSGFRRAGRRQRSSKVKRRWGSLRRWERCSMGSS
jgi:hypothetical protein